MKSIGDEQVRRIALFFLFSLTDEKVALQAAHKVVAQVKAGFRGDDDENARLIQILRKTYDQQRKLLPRSRTTVAPEGAWTIPTSHLAAWMRFQKDASEQDVIAVVLSNILGFKDDDIAKGLGISLGTARYRIGKGVRQLGQFIQATA